MDWSKVKKTPRYNPFMFEVARHVRGWTKTDLSKRCKLAVKTISQIENGEIEPTQVQVDVLASEHGTNFPLSFFEQYLETKLDMSGPIARNIPINYYKYKVFRDINPPQMSAV